MSHRPESGVRVSGLEIGAHEAGKHFPKLLARVQQGEGFVITRYGKPVAELRPVGSRCRDDIRSAIAWLDDFQTAHSSASPTVRELIREAREDRQPRPGSIRIT